MITSAPPRNPMISTSPMNGAKDAEIGTDSDKKTLEDRKKPREAETDQLGGV